MEESFVKFLESQVELDISNQYINNEFLVLLLS